MRIGPETVHAKVEAAENGKLEGVLKESGGAAAHSAEELKKAEGARKKAGNMLVTAVDNGDFEKILKELQENKSGKKNEEKLRHKAWLRMQASNTATCCSTAHLKVLHLVHFAATPGRPSRQNAATRPLIC